MCFILIQNSAKISRKFMTEVSYVHDFHQIQEKQAFGF